LASLYSWCAHWLWGWAGHGTKFLQIREGNENINLYFNSDIKFDENNKLSLTIDGAGRNQRGINSNDRARSTFCGIPTSVPSMVAPLIMVLGHYQK
jgi:hypothetical protein